MMKKILLIGCLLSIVTPRVKAEAIDIAFITKVTLVSVATCALGVWAGRKSSNEAELKQLAKSLLLRAQRAEREVEDARNQRDEVQQGFEECERLRNRWKLTSKIDWDKFPRWMQKSNTTQ